MPCKSFDVINLLGVSGENFPGHFFVIENMARSKFNFILNQYFVNLKYLYSKVNIQKQHGNKQADYNGDQ